MTGSWRDGYAGQRVLVLGATGFIGRQVTAALVASGAEVLVGVRPGSGPVPGANDLPVDLAAEGSGARLIAASAPAVTFNLAGYGVSPAERDPGLARRLNADLPRELATVTNGPRPGNWMGQQLVHVGSALEYGRAPGNLLESTPPEPTTLYGQTKLAGTEAVAAATATGRLAGATVRLFTVYGPGERAGRLTPSLLAAARTRAEIPLTAGEQRRDFTYLDDVVEGLLRVGLVTAEGVGTVNLATGTLTRVRDFVLALARAAGIDPARLRFGDLPTRPEEMRHEPVRVDRLQALTGWRPGITVEEGVGRLVREAGDAGGETREG